jgi:allantoinase
MLRRPLKLEWVSWKRWTGAMSDVVVRGATLVTKGLPKADISIEDGRIHAIGPDLPGAKEEIDARGLHLFPGVVDVHLHFNEPGRTEWEGAETGSRAFAAGGGTLYFDMPLNSTPCTINARAFDRKHEALTAASVTDFGLWGGLVPGNLSEMAELASRGVVGFKAFMCDSGLPEFPRADDVTLLEGLREAARFNLPVAVHAESHELTLALQHRMREEGRSGIRAFLDSRPVAAELEAIERATSLAGEAGAKLHIVHVSSGRGVVAAAEARARGVDVSIETCPHYLFFTEEDVERLGAVAKCAPPLRQKCEQDELWAELLKGTLDMVASDHSPAPPEMKSGDFDRAWGGIAGVQSTLAVLLDRGHHARGLELERIGALLGGNPARRFRIANKGSLVPGADADLAIVDVSRSFDLQAEDLMQRHRISPYVGQRFRGAVERTIRRGETIFMKGKITARSRGVLVRPS